ncbi:MAG TPA: pyridoxal-dependent decarboxylase [Gemmatimonadales bacterium]|nr:pyridoxal-dependent decarboxylase [Gemmatimonadales bacterium]
MTPEAFRRHGHEVVDWIADYWRDIGERPVLPDVRPGEVRASLPPHAPESGASFDAIMADFGRLIVPGITHWGHPGWFAYFPSNASPPSVLAEMLTAGMGAQCMSWITSPAATELEQVVMAWLRELLGIPEGFTGSIQDTASSATLVAFLTARTRLGEDASRMTAYWSGEAHSSIAKAARLAGLPIARCRIVPVDDHFAMRPEALAAMLEADRAAGLVPGIVVATVGTTSSTACDPLPRIGTLARSAGAWFHVDGAYGGTAAILPEIRPLLGGLDLADSYVTNPHKWLMTSFDCTAYFVRDVDALLQTCSVNPEYLKTAHDADVVNYRDWGIPLGRRFRALKLWFVLRSYGAEGLRAMFRTHLALAQEFAGWVDAAAGWERLAPVPFGLVCCRHVPTDLVGDEAALAEHNRALLARVNASGRVFLTHTTLSGRYAIRMSIGQFRTERRHVEEAFRLLQIAARPDGRG